jgi:hypothetical protein
MPDPCQFIQDEIDNIEQEISNLEDALNEVPPAVRAALLRQIGRLRQQLRLKRTELQSCEHDPSRYFLQLDGIEVTQAIQDVAHSVPLVAGKRSGVRVYLSYYGSPGVTVRGEITVSRSGSSVTVPSVNVVTLDPALAGTLNPKRNNAALSLNFILPNEQTTPGYLNVSVSRVTNAASGAAMTVMRASTVEVQFQAATTLRVRILGMRYSQGTPPTVFVPTPLDFGLLVSWLRRAYPVTNVVSSQAVIDAAPAVPFGCGDINAQLAAIRALDIGAGTDHRTHYYGLVSDGGFFMRGCAAGIPSTPDPSTVASGPTGPGTWGWDTDGSYGDWYGGHELGHTFGRFHPGFCRGESHDDPAYPFADGQLANTDDAFVGFDVGDPAYSLPMAALPGTDWHDVMTYCNTQWMSSYTYEGIYTRLVAEDGLAAGPVLASGYGGAPDDRYPDKPTAKPGTETVLPLIHVVATVNLTKVQGKINFVHPLSQGLVSGIERDSTVILRFKRADEQVLREYPVGVKLRSCIDPGEDRTGLVDATIGVEVEARIVELLVAGQLVDIYRGSERLPAVRALKRMATGPEHLRVAWESDAQPGEHHTYIIQASTDEGRTWQTLAVGLTKPDYTIDRSNFQGARQVQVRVIVTNGFTQSVLTSETFQIADHE